MITKVDSTGPVEEARHHHYTTNRIPWYVHVIWILFWCLVVYYAIEYFVPMIQLEMQSPP